jgi:hypothetical protein
MSLLGRPVAAGGLIQSLINVHAQQGSATQLLPIFSIDTLYRNGGSVNRLKGGTRMPAAGLDEHGLVDVHVHAPKTPDVTLPVYRFRQAPSGLATKRQLRAMGLRPGGQDPVAEVETRGPRNGLLYEIAKALPVRPMTLAKEAALDKAMAARQTCGQCGRRFFHCLPKRLGMCLECHDGTPAHPSSYLNPPTAARSAA